MERTWGTVKERKKKTKAKYKAFRTTKKRKRESAKSYLNRVNKKYKKIMKR